MYSFLVGGYLPGTDIQLSFQAYLAIVAVLGGSVRLSWGGIKSWLTHESRHWHLPLEANQLHHRG